MALSGLLEFGGVGVELVEEPRDPLRLEPQLLEPPGKRRGVKPGTRPEATITRQIVARAKDSAAGGSDRPHARGALCDQNAHQVLPLAVHAERVIRYLGPPAGEHLYQHTQELHLVDRAAWKLKVDRHVGAGGLGMGQ